MLAKAVGVAFLYPLHYSFIMSTNVFNISLSLTVLIGHLYFTSDWFLFPNYKSWYVGIKWLVNFIFYNIYQCSAYNMPKD